MINCIILSKCYAEKVENWAPIPSCGSGRIARKVRSDIVVGGTVVGPRISQGSGLHLSAFFCEFFLSFFLSRLPHCLRRSPAPRMLTLDTRHRETLRVCLVKWCRCATSVRDTDTRTRAKRNFLAATRSIQSSIRENIDELAQEVGSATKLLGFRDIRVRKIFIFRS